MNSIRAFIAIDLPPSLRSKVQLLIDRLSLRVPQGSVRWIRGENIHLTVSFLGEVEPSLIDSIKRAIDQTCLHIHPFSVAAHGLGTFPSARSPRIIWVGVEEKPELMHLANAIRTAVQLPGIEAESRPFSPHLTIGRIPAGTARDSTTTLKQALHNESTLRLGSIMVQQVVLYRSVLRPGGAEYTPIGLTSLSSLK